VDELTPDNTRDKLLIYGERLFSQKGFAEVSVREITTAAESNLAAVNYHFGNKMNLYLAVFKERWVPRARRIREYFDKYLSGIANPGIADILRSFATAFLEGPMTDRERYDHFNLMQREMANPSEALNIVVKEVIQPTHKSIRELIKPFLPDDVSVEKLSLSIFSSISMILYFGFARPVVSRVMNQEFDEKFKSHVIDHIVSFSLNGINGLIEETAP